MSTGRAITYGPMDLTRAQIESLQVFLTFDRVVVASVPGSHYPGKTISRSAARSMETAMLITVAADPQARRKHVSHRAVLTERGMDALGIYAGWRGYEQEGEAG